MLKTFFLRGMTSSQEKLLLFLIALFFIITTRDVYMRDTGDYFRVLCPLVTEDRETIRMDTYAGILSYHLRDSFLPLKEGLGIYASSYSLITYLIAKIIKLFTNIFNLRLVAVVWKTVFFISAVSLYKNITGFHRLSLSGLLFFLLASLFLVSSSNIAFFNSFYAEQVALIAIIWIVNYFVDTEGEKAMGRAMLLSCLLLSTSKNQFFYIPGLITWLVFLRREEGPFPKSASIIALCFIQVAAIICVVLPSPNNGVNRYHATYFGSYLWLKNNNRDLGGIPNKDCIGIDTWGSRFDMNAGAVNTLNTSCYEMNKQVSFLDSLSVFKKNPDIIYRLPVDKAINEQMYYDYFHVFKSTKILADANPLRGLYSRLTYLKDDLLKPIKFPALFFLLLSGSILLKADRKWSLVLLTLSATAVSQFYISFIGEGYRDFGKHIFLLNYSFDLILFCFASLIGRKVMTYWT